MPDLVLYSMSERVATLTLNRPETRNALSPELVESLIDQFRYAERDPQVKCIVIRGAGENLSSGGDVKGFNETLTLSSQERFSLFEKKLLVGSRLPNLLLNSRKPVIVEARGAVAGAGLALCLAADITICGKSSFFIAAHIHVGLSLDQGLSSLLVASVGVKAAKRLAFLGERVSAEEAASLGLVTQVVPDEELSDSMLKTARRLAKGPSVGLAGSKALLNLAAYPNFNEQLAAEAKHVAHCAATDDFLAGIRATLNGKRAEFE
ncbi:2-(1,2-epoxy-1,2-dihydrophenyl)acetyl-CoA isomerase [Marinobacter sp. es.048]|uniref:enoyl-CoA hydratase/isomerase family protein n=1 Tax=Marinobacter sp. es.048 TaxID=1761795 RepID=UPI000B589D65|nr:enoyl-CoA hydratase-related protein [Marinobacter sp. es.048]SNC62773.1 2-(1,2-epoxy-1,2-dihydrophenyl)acetyl-CoA isomerase [Marinobacter sp. es.048]